MSKVIADMSLDASVDRQVLDDAFAEAGAVVVGRDMLGSWDDVNSLPCPVFVLTDRVDVQQTLAQARAAAGDRNVVLGGADVVRRFLAAGLVDELAAPSATRLRYHVIH